MRKLLLSLLFVVTSFKLFAFSYPHMGYVIEAHTPSANSIGLQSGSTTTLSGNICLKKAHFVTGKMKCLPSYNKQITIRAFFPDATTEVTDQLVLDKQGKQIYYEFNTPVLSADSNTNALTIIIGPKISRVDHLLRIKAKLDKRIVHFNLVIEKYRPYPRATRVIELLTKVRDRIQSVSDKIAKVIDGNPDILAKLVYPLQVDNNYSSNYSASTMFGGFRLALTAELGSPIEGESTVIKTAVTNFSHLKYIAPGLGLYKDEGHVKGSFYKIDYGFRGVNLLTTQEAVIPLGESVEDVFAVQKLNADDLNKFSITFSKVRNGLKWFNWFKKQKVAHIENTIPVANDEVKPTYKEELFKEITDDSYHQILPLIKTHFFDQFGRLDSETFSMSYVFDGFDGDHQEVNVLPLLNTVKVREGQEYTQSANLGTVKEGHYEFTVNFADFAGNNPVINPLVKKLYVDRTSPVITIFTADNQLTNNPGFDLEFKVVDHAPTTTKIFRNGTEIFSTADKEGIYNLQLDEGNNILLIASVDAAGNIAEIKSLQNIELDTIPPELSDISPATDAKVFVLDFSFSGKANEPLSKVTYNNTVEAVVNENSFSGTASVPAQAIYDIPVEAYDLAGNKTIVNTNVEFILKILNKDLITIMPKDNDPSKVIIRGGDWASRPGIPVQISGGFFSTKTQISDSKKGFFEFEMDFATRFVLYATDSELNRTETVNLEYNADTTLSGVIKDINDRPLNGVQVTILSSGQTAITDGNGVFTIADPATGDQEIIIDGTVLNIEEEQVEVGEEVVESNGVEVREFSKVTVSVNLAPNRLNTITDTIYLAPLIKDGTETLVDEINPDTGETSATTVESVHAPGVILEIEADSTVFPSGHKIGAINMIEIPIEKTSIGAPDYIKPKTVIALEPSGLKFSIPATLTLPNVNEFPPGIEVVIMSKNSTNGVWEIDGVGTVSADGGSITTNDGMGITHFSEVFAAPRGLKISEPSGKDMPGANVFDGAVKTAIATPTYKVFGKDIGAGLIYNSSWANPSAVVTNILDIPRDEQIIKRNLGSGGFMHMKASAHFEGKSWVEPDWIDAFFYTGDFASGKATFTGVPNKSKVSYGVDLASQKSGVQPYRSHYEIHLKNMVLGTIVTKEKNWLGKTRIKKKAYSDAIQIEEIFPTDVNGTITIQNKINSEAGRGWKIAGIQKILNPESPRIALEEGDGKVSYYSSNNVIQTLYKHDVGVRSFFVAGSKAIVTDATNSIYEVDLEDSSKSTITSVPSLSGVYGSKYRYYKKKCNWVCKKKYYCRQYENSYTSKREIRQVIQSPDGSYIAVDQSGALLQIAEDGTIAKLAGGYVSMSASIGGCGNSLVSCGSRRTVADWKTGTCPNRASSGVIVSQGFANGTLSSAKFNSITNIASAPEGKSLVIADSGNNAVRILDLVTNQVWTVAGNRDKYDTGDGGPATQAGIYHPRGVVYDKFGNLYISTERGYIRKVDTNGVISTYAGKPNGELNNVTLAEDAGFYNPYGMVIDNENDYLYVADTGNNRVVRIDMKTKIATQVAGNGTCSSSPVVGDGGTALDAQICSPEFLYLDENNNLLIQDSGHNSLRRVVFNKTETGSSFYAPTVKDSSTLIKNSDGTFERHYRDGMKVYFNKLGHQVRSESLIGHSMTFVYSEDGKLLTQIDPAGRKIEYNYNFDGLLESISDPVERTTSFFYEDGQLIGVEYPDTTTRRYVYDNEGKGLLVQEHDQLDHPTTYHYNDWMRLKATEQVDGSIIKISDESSKTMSNGSSVESPKRLVSGDSDEIASIRKDAKGFETKFFADGTGYTNKIIDSQERVTLIERDIQGRPLKITRPDETEITFVYDQQTGDLLSKTDSSSLYGEQMTYSAFGRLLSRSDSNGNSVTNVYNENGSILSTSDHLGRTTNYEHYPNGLIFKKSYPLGKYEKLSYDEFGNVDSKEGSDQKSTWYGMDTVGNVTSITNGENQSTMYSFDLWNRLTGVKTSLGDETIYTYTVRGKLESILDPRDNLTAFTYNKLGQLSKKELPDGQVYERDYDKNGNVDWLKDPNGNIQLLEYNADNKVVKKTLPDNVYEMNYSDTGKLTYIRNKNSEVTMTYERILGEEKTTGSTVSGFGDLSNYGYSVEYQFDELGRQYKTISPVGEINYGFDSVDRLRSIVNHKSETFSFDPDALNRIIKITRPGSHSTMDFNDKGIVNVLKHYKSSNSSIVNKFEIDYDFIGNKRSIATSLGTQNFTYDKSNQLLTASNSEVTPTQSEAFTYGPLGNRLSENGKSNVYDEKFQRLLSDTKYVYAFDENGNMIQKTTHDPNIEMTKFIYSSENQLVGISIHKAGEEVKKINYTYDPLGRRIEKSIEDLKDSSKSLKRRFNYDGHEVIQVLDENQNTLANYTHSTLKTDDTLSVEITDAGKNAKLASAAQSYFYLKNSLGSIVDIVDGSGNIVQHYIYSSFGEIEKVTNGSGEDITETPVVKPYFTFTNRELDDETGMYYYRARFYIPALGRFLQVDPHLGNLQNPLSHINSYTYVLNNPSVFTDPSGEFACGGICIAIVVGAVVGFGVNFEASFNSTDENGNKRGFSWKTFGSGAIGALSGAAIGASSTVTGPMAILAAVAGSAFFTAANNAGNQYLFTGKVNSDQVGMAAVSGTFAGIGGQMFRFAPQTLTRFGAQQFGLGMSTSLGMGSSTGVPQDTSEDNSSQQEIYFRRN